MLSSFFKNVQKVVNAAAGGNYREIYFRRHPGDTHQCNAPECRVKLSKDDCNLTIDHIVPQSLGGTNAITNLQVLCRSCNSKKKDKIAQLTGKYQGQALLRELKKVIGY